MPFTSDPPFARGATLAGGLVASPDSTFGGNFAGIQKMFMDVTPSTGVMNTLRQVRCIALRNSTGATLTKGQLVKFRVGDALSLAVTTDAQVAVVDEYIPSAGVGANDVFWAVVEGPTSVATAATPAVGTKIGVGTLGNAIAGLGLGETIATASGGLVRAIVGGTVNSAAIPTAT